MGCWGRNLMALFVLVLSPLPQVHASFGRTSRIGEAVSGADPEGQVACGAGGHPGQREPRVWVVRAGVGEWRAHVEGSVGLAEEWSLVLKKRQAENPTLTPTLGWGLTP